MRVTLLIAIALAFAAEIWFIGWNNARLNALNPPPPVAPAVEPPPGLPAGLDDGLEIGKTLAAAVEVNPQAATAETEVLAVTIQSPALGSYIVDGIVRDAQGAPVPGVTVKITPEPMQEKESAADAKAPVWEMGTNNDGRFRFDTLPEGHFRATASAEGYAAHGTFTLNAQHEGVRLTLHLEPAGEVRGVLRDEAGNPLAGGIVYARFAESVARQESGTDGRFVFADLTAPATFVATRNDLPFAQSAEPTAPGATLDLAPGELRSLRGTVLNEATGAGVSGVRVQLRHEHVPGPPVTVTSGRNGVFALDHVLPGDYTAQVDDGRYFSAQLAKASLAPGSAAPGELRVFIKRTATVRGRVEQPDTGRGLAGATVRLRRLSSDSGSAQVLSDVTDQGGYFRMSGLHPGPYAVDSIVYAGNVQAFEPQAFVLDAGDRRQLEAIALAAPAATAATEPAPSAAIEGRVVYENGDPAVGALVHYAAAPALSPDNGGAETVHAVRTDSIGRFRIELGNAENLQLCVQASRGGIYSAEFGPLPVSDSLWLSRVLTLDHPASSTLSGTVRDVTGRPLGAVMVQVRSEKQPVLPMLPFERRLSVAEDGGWETRELTPGTYRIQVVAGDGTVRTLNSGDSALEMTLAAGEQQQGIELVVN